MRGKLTDSGAARWPTVARDVEVRRALAALGDDAEFRGVALVGESGVGKSTLARGLASTVESRRQPVRFVLGVETGRDIPLGAFSRSITVDAAEPSAMLAAAHRSLEQQPNLVIVVDDAQLLDPLSATLVYQLAEDRTARLIVTIRSGEEVPDAITALLKERLLLNLRINAFTPEQTGELARAILGDTVESRLIDELYKRTAGNLLLLRGLLSPGRESGVLVHTSAGWQLRGPLHPDRELYDLLEFRLRSLAPEELTVIEVLATAELLDWQILRALCDSNAVERLERRGLIQLVADGSDTVARLNHPIIGEVATELAGVVRSRKLNGLLAQAFQEHLRHRGGHLRLPDLRGQIRLAQFQMRSDTSPDLDMIIHAAESAAALSNVAGAEALARFALAHGGGLRAAIPLADALRWQGRSAEAEAVLAEFDPDGRDELLTARWGCLRVMNLFGGCGQPEAAREVLADVRDRAGHGQAAGLITATQAWVTLYSGDPAKAIDIGLSVCGSDVYPLATVWAAATTCWALALVGRYAEVGRVAQVGRAAAGAGASGPQLLGMELAEAVGWTAAGDLAAAEQIVERNTGVGSGLPEAEAVVNALRAHVQLARGALPSACAALRKSASLLAAGFQPGGLALVSAWLAQAEGARGDVDAATAALRSAEDTFGLQVAVFAPELELARAWVQVAAGRTTVGQHHAVRAAQIARQNGMYAVELRALHTAVRFCHPGHAARLAALSSMLAAPLPEAVAMHADGVANRDGDLLDAVAQRFFELGTMAMAADAAAQAASAHGRAGNRAAELRSAGRALHLAGQLDLHSPAVVAIANPLPITAREREIATLAAAGLSNREIAERLGVSVRTVGGHLYRIFGKLDIQSRDQLAYVIGIPGATTEQNRPAG